MLHYAGTGLSGIFSLYTGRLLYECLSQGAGLLTQVEKAQKVQGVACSVVFEVVKPCICWQWPYLLPSSFLAEEILSQYEKGRSDARQQCKNTAIMAILFFSASQTVRGEAELVHPQLSKLLKSILYDYRHDFWNGKTSKCGNDRDRQT